MGTPALARFAAHRDMLVVLGNALRQLLHLVLARRQLWRQQGASAVGSMQYQRQTKFSNKHETQFPWQTSIRTAAPPHPHGG